MDSQKSSWPTASILIWGTFGTKTPEGRRYHNRCIGALVMMTAAMVLTALLLIRMPGDPGIRLIQALLPGVAFGVIFWEFWRYIHSLDELARRIQLEAALATYATGIVLGILLGGFTLIYGGNWAWGINPGWIVFLEPIRGGWLYVFARRY